ncbi:two-component system response regulator [Paenibacillus sp. BIHB 4019]|uniref:Two-component system response regulator n=1 Tax=Paenibacillus sp. BIHB 4019 TaxID=1870819 RepID=A0A1B2DP13_9BACL|nr:response regulator [Paenibacillus sp. BIHB 4019]ANY69456.1 two-component system response regulator [Paenibacillus sp. BIHB 4019]
MNTVLLIEDNEMNRDMLSRRLERKGYRIITAEDGRQGVDLAEEMLPDLILMDLSLPVLDGWEATRLLKSSAHTKHIPVIALTAHAMTDDEEKAYQAGCDDFDTKPVVLERLLEKMKAALEKERA